jgi:predicted transcriptional regulator
MEIVYSILRASMEGALRTHIMFRCNLNSLQLNLYLQFLVDRSLLDRQHDPEGSKTEYNTTDLGRSYMRAYERLYALVGPRDFASIQVKA